MQALFTLQEDVKATKTDELRCLFVKKTNLVLDKQLFINVPFQSTNYKKKELWVENKMKKHIGDMCCPTCRIEKCVWFPPIKRLVSTTAKSAKPAITFWTFVLRTRNTIMLFVGDGTPCFAGKTSRDYEKEKRSPFLKKFHRQSQSSTPEREPKKQKFFPFTA